MRRPLIIAALAGSLLVACSEQPTEAPSAPEVAPPTMDVGPAACSLNSLLDLTKALFPPSPTLNTIIATLKALPTNPQLRLSAAIRATVFGIIDVVTKAYNAGKLAGGKSAATQANLLAFLNGLYCFVGLPAPSIPLGALDPNEGAIAVITPTSGNTLVRPASKHGGVFIPAASVTTTTVVTVSILSPFPLLTSLDQYPLFYQFSSSPEVTFTKFVTTAVCLGDFFPLLAAPRLAHNVGTTFGAVEVLPPTSGAGVVDCTSLPVIGSRGVMDRLFASVFMPAELHATTAALLTTAVGGTTKKFSPFGTVDAASNPGTVSVKSGVPTQSFTAPGETVSPSPAVVVRSKNGTPTAKVPVTFTASAGSTVNGGATQTVNTDANGLATATNWVVGNAGDYTLMAAAPSIAATGTVEPYQPAAAFNPASQTFTATVVGSIGYGATGYRYLLSPIEGSFPPAGFETIGFNDSDWSTGDAGFGHDDGTGCSLNNPETNVTDWPVNSQILLRKRFTLPGGGSTGIVTVAIDNDIKVFVNGVNVTATGGTPDTDGFVRHEGCPAQGSLTFIATGLSAGVNLLVIQARDRGGSSYVDASVDAPVVIQ